LSSTEWAAEVAQCRAADHDAVATLPHGIGQRHQVVLFWAGR
jgi:hypothetical protein